MTKHVVYLDSPTDKSLPSATALQVAGSGAQVHVVTNEQAAMAAIKALPEVTAFVSNHVSKVLFETLRAEKPNALAILVTSQPMHVYSATLGGQEPKLLDHVIASRANTQWLSNEVRITLQKILSQDIFGIEKYLAPNTTVHASVIKSSDERETHNASAMRFAEQNQLGQHQSKMIFGIAEEMLMNAIYDAPVAAGVTRFKNTSRNSLIKLEPNEYPTLRYATDGDTFAISITDPFGALRKEKLLEYLQKVLRRGDSSQLIDTKQGGAGLGLFKIFYCSHALVCNVEPKKCTEVIALIDINDQLRDFAKMPRSIHYFRG